MLAHAPFALAPRVGFPCVFALGVVLAVAGGALALPYDSLRLLVRMRPDHMSCLCCCVP